MTIFGGVRNKLSIIVGPALEQLYCQQTKLNMFGEHIFLQSSERFITREICIVCWLQAALWQLNMNEIYSNLHFFFKEGFSTFKMQRIFHYKPKYVLFSPVKIPFFSNYRAVWIKLNKFTIKNLTCNDVTTVCMCYALFNITSIFSKLSL